MCWPVFFTISVTSVVKWCLSPFVEATDSNVLPIDPLHAQGVILEAPKLLPRYSLDHVPISLPFRFVPVSGSSDIWFALAILFVWSLVLRSDRILPGSDLARQRWPPNKFYYRWLGYRHHKAIFFLWWSYICHSDKTRSFMALKCTGYDVRTSHCCWGSSRINIAKLVFLDFNGVTESIPSIRSLTSEFLDILYRLFDKFCNRLQGG